jgi:hypothetical protein
MPSCPTGDKIPSCRTGQSKGKRSVGFHSYFSHIFTTFFRVDATASLRVLGLLVIVIIVLLLCQEHTTFGMAPPGSGRW